MDKKINKKIVPGVLFVLAAFVVGYVAYYFATNIVERPNKQPTPAKSQSNIPEVNNNENIVAPEITFSADQITPAPTLSEEEKAIIANAKEYNIDIQNNAFNPSEITVKTNDSITITNKDSSSHNLKSSSTPDEIELVTDDFFVISFGQSQTAEYSLVENPEAKLKITVE